MEVRNTIKLEGGLTPEYDDAAEEPLHIRNTWCGQDAAAYTCRIRRLRKCHMRGFRLLPRLGTGSVEGDMMICCSALRMLWCCVFEDGGCERARATMSTTSSCNPDSQN